MGRPSNTQTKPCEYCGKPVTRTGREQAGRKFWTCPGRFCADKLRERAGTWTVNPFAGQMETRICGGCRNPDKPISKILTPRNQVQVWYHDGHCRGTGITRQRIQDGTWVRPQKPRSGDTIPCAFCGTLFYRSPTYIKENRRYHTPECWNEAQRAARLYKTCAYCGIEMRPRPSEKDRAYCSKDHESRAKIKRPTGREHNGRPVIQNEQGYLTIYEPTHPSASRTGRVLEHRWVVEQSIGRYLATSEQIDHINRDKADNRLENLRILSPTEHSRWTNGQRKVRELTTLEKLAEYERRFGQLD